jgi:hypothetical protein
MILCITGMGRSGTSLVASLMQKTGINLGNRLVAPDRANPRGFFEDADFYEFHDRLLRERRYGILVPADFQLEPSQDEIAQARGLIAARQDLSVWGWKDPRTTLFLDFWKQLVPETFFLFLYRHPLEVVLSLVRCRALHAGGMIEALDSWCVYNRKVQEFQKQYPTQCLVCHPYRIVEDLQGFLHFLDQRTGLTPNLGPEALDSVYYPAELRRIVLAAEVEDVLHRLHPASAKLYAQLQANADWPCSPFEGAEDKASPARIASGFLANLPEPLAPATRRGILFLLLSLLDPDTLEQSAQEHGQYLDDLQRGKVWLEEQRLNWKQAAERAQNQMKEQERWKEELNQSLVWTQDQLARWQQTAAEREQVIQEQKVWIEQLKEKQAWIDRLQETQAWLEAERASWQRTAQEVEKVCREQQVWIDELRETQVWLEAERTSWQRTAQELEKTSREQQVWVDQLRETQVWLEGERTSWQRSAQELEKTSREQQAWIAELQAVKEWFTQERANWEQAAQEREQLLQERDQQIQDRENLIQEQKAWILELSAAKTWFLQQLENLRQSQAHQRAAS